jgi:probable rRNA maturation factor
MASKMAVNFFNEITQFVLRDKRLLRAWIKKTIESEGKLGKSVNFVFCDDEYLSELNIKYLKHNTLTDILTFPQEEEGGFISGDIFISVPRIKENALLYNVPFTEELHRVMIHGILHLTGYKDSTKNEKTEMKGKEDFYLSQLFSGE